uniref:Uncharacterized protein n=1 Tax=Parascaris univalens TaxID=6257 RepID=A0A915B223_PARUN
MKSQRTDNRRTGERIERTHFVGIRFTEGSQMERFFQFAASPEISVRARKPCINSRDSASVLKYVWSCYPLITNNVLLCGRSSTPGMSGFSFVYHWLVFCNCS